MNSENSEMTEEKNEGGCGCRDVSVQLLNLCMAIGLVLLTVSLYGLLSLIALGLRNGGTSIGMTILAFLILASAGIGTVLVTARWIINGNLVKPVD